RMPEPQRRLCWTSLFAYAAADATELAYGQLLGLLRSDGGYPDLENAPSEFKPPTPELGTFPME
ncbi:MAG TPA: hypothetical protein VF637_08355, partial [Sphingomicrobium sp.]